MCWSGWFKVRYLCTQINLRWFEGRCLCTVKWVFVWGSHFEIGGVWWRFEFEMVERKTSACGVLTLRLFVGRHLCVGYLHSDGLYKCVCMCIKYPTYFEMVRREASVMWVWERLRYSIILQPFTTSFNDSS